MTGTGSDVRCHSLLVLSRVPTNAPCRQATRPPGVHLRKDSLLIRLEPAGRVRVLLGLRFPRRQLERRAAGLWMASLFETLRRFLDAGADVCAGGRGGRAPSPSCRRFRS